MKWDLPTVLIDEKEYYLYFSYGSNLNLTQMANRCPSSIPLERAELLNYHLLFRGDEEGGWATIEPKRGKNVPGALWAISEEDFATLDRYEDFPTLYTRGAVEVITEQGKKKTAVTYWMLPHYKKAIPSKRYLNTIYEGYRDFQLDPSRLQAFYEAQMKGMIEK